MTRRAILLALVLVPSVPTPAFATEPRPWITGLRFAVNMAWTGDGTLFYAEKETGDVRVIVDGGLVEDPVTHVDVSVSSETGLLGLAAAPGWPDEPWLYLYYSDAADGRNRLIRVRVTDGRESGRETLFDPIETTAFHDGGELLFGADGMLYLATGDGTEPDAAQDPSDPRGKILRFEPDGSVPDDPVPGNPLFTLGHRNSFGLCSDPGTGAIWETENGEPTDELNRLVRGGNYGWPVGQGPIHDERFRDPVLTFTDLVPTGCAVWRDAVYLGSYLEGRLLRLPLSPLGRQALVVARFDAPVYDVAVGPDDGLYVSTGDTIWRFGSPPRSIGTEGEADGEVGSSTPPWLWGSIALVLAAWLLLSLRTRPGRR